MSLKVFPCFSIASSNRAASAVVHSSIWSEHNLKFSLSNIGGSSIVKKRGIEKKEKNGEEREREIEKKEN